MPYSSAVFHFTIDSAALCVGAYMYTSTIYPYTRSPLIVLSQEIRQ